MGAVFDFAERLWVHDETGELFFDKRLVSKTVDKSGWEYLVAQVAKATRQERLLGSPEERAMEAALVAVEEMESKEALNLDPRDKAVLVLRVYRELLDVKGPG